MKYKGKKLEGRNTDVLVLFRGDERIALKFQAIESFTEFEELAPGPIPPEIMRPGGVKEKNVRDPEYKQQVEAHARLRTSWLVITSLKVTDDVEWEVVDYSDPSTWDQWNKELMEAGFSEPECARIVATAAQVNSLDDEMLEQARQDFLAEESQAKESSSQKVERPST